MEDARQIGLIFVAITFYILPIVALGWLSRRLDFFGRPRFPDWIYGLSTSFRFHIASLCLAIGLFLIVMQLQVVWQAGVHPPEGSMVHLVMLLIATAPTAALALWVFKTRHLRRSYEQTYLEGIPVKATIVGRSEDSLKPTIGTGGTMAAAEATMARGAYLILKGAWEVTIHFDLDGKNIEDTRRVCSRVYYRYRGATSLPILVRPAAPTEWVPELEPREQEATSKASRRVPKKAAVLNPS